VLRKQYMHRTRKKGGVSFSGTASVAPVWGTKGMDDELSRCTKLMERMLESPEEFEELMRQFQQIVWNRQHTREDKAWRVIEDLAYNLDFYEPDPRRRAQDYSFFDKDRALAEIERAKNELTELMKQ
jgi:hypothetical protein